jgi:hypothetical protein
MNISKSVVTAIIVGSLVGAYVWYIDDIWDYILTRFGIEASAFTYSVGAGIVVLIGFVIARLVTHGMGKKS